MSNLGLALPRFGMPEEERRRLIGEGKPPRTPRPRRISREERDPMDAFVWAAIGVMGSVTFVYCVLFLRAAVDTDFNPPAGALQALLAVIPVATAVVMLRKDK